MAKADAFYEDFLGCEDAFTLPKPDGRGDWDQPKSESSRAAIPVDAHVIQRIERLKSLEVTVRAGHATRRYPAVKSDGPDGLVFQSVAKGAPMRDNNILARHIMAATGRCGREGCQGIMRHSRASATQDVCRQLVPESPVNAVRRLTAYLEAGRLVK